MEDRRDFEIEEEFDPGILGLGVNPGRETTTVSPPWSVTVEASSTRAKVSLAYPQDEGPLSRTLATSSSASDAVDNGSSRPKPPFAGRYSSADWSPEPTPFDVPQATTGHAQDVNGHGQDVYELEGGSVVRDEPNDSRKDVLIAPPDHDASAVSTTSLGSGGLTNTPANASLTGPVFRRKPDVELVRVRMSGRKAWRRGIRVRPPRSVTQAEPLPIVQNDVEGSSTESARPESVFQNNLVKTFDYSVLSKLETLAKLNNTSGAALPPQLRELFPALANLKTAVHLANDVRTHLDLPLLSTRTDQVGLRRAVATARERLYVELGAALALPLPPTPLGDEPPVDKEGVPLKLDMSMTPMSLDLLAKKLPASFPADRASIKDFLANRPDNVGAEYGELAHSVVWERGVGRMMEKEGVGVRGVGFRGNANSNGLVHVFVDHSNILHGLLHHFYNNNSESLPQRYLRTLSLPCLSLLLRRGRVTPPGSLHLVASSPLRQDLDPLVRLGWEVSILKRVEVYEDEVLDPLAMELKPRVQSHPYGPGAPFEAHGLGRYREQGVDEILHLKLLQALNTKSVPAPKGSTIVLATGDAKGGQFNQDGFLGAVREALKRGWTVELWSWRAGLSRAWAETAKREKWDQKFGIHVLDEWAEQLIEVANQEADL